MPEVHHHHGENAHGELITMYGPAPHTCGYALDSFACKIRHVNLQTGWARKDH